ncbi:MAG TPA: glycosyltransferase [Tepidisphaeraceae bacterium]
MNLSAFVAEIDLSQPLADIHPRPHHRAVWSLVKFNRQPLGWIKIPRARFGRTLTPDIQRSAISEKLSLHIIDACNNRSFEDLASPHTPGISVVVCTREHPDQLQRQLRSLAKLDYPNFEILVVDNAPRTTRTRAVCDKFPSVRYTLEPRKGLDYARNAGWQAATKEIVAYTDDDATVDPHWLSALADNYREADVECVTGCTFPMELETEAQELFEKYGGMQRGFARRKYRPGTWNDFFPLGSGRFGAGVNLSLRRSTLQRLGGFDPALDCGSIARGGGDLDIMARVITTGGSLIYEPRALVWHQHRVTMDALRQQMFDYGWGFVSYVIKQSRDLEMGNRAMKMLRRWTRFWGINRFKENLKLAICLREHFPLHLIVLEVAGGILGLAAYERSVRKVHSDTRRYKERGIHKAAA